ncbi:unnamed protein product [Arabidopsis arenosa]|uniref:Uncharacterized protein n=1 Tax=Arabidopsis arenosa TaxID=38785 RepID=A0A8S2A2N6_ARAAE|nr:unnamed protein product [Arabidopsis arenosa]
MALTPAPSPLSYSESTRLDAKDKRFPEGYETQNFSPGVVTVSEGPPRNLSVWAVNSYEIRCFSLFSFSTYTYGFSDGWMLAMEKFFYLMGSRLQWVEHTNPLISRKLWIVGVLPTRSETECQMMSSQHSTNLRRYVSRKQRDLSTGPLGPSYNVDLPSSKRRPGRAVCLRIRSSAHPPPPSPTRSLPWDIDQKQTYSRNLHKAKE